jgi:hypothetical protein
MVSPGFFYLGILFFIILSKHSVYMLQLIFSVFLYFVQNLGYI